MRTECIIRWNESVSAPFGGEEDVRARVCVAPLGGEEDVRARARVCVCVSGCVRVLQTLTKRHGQKEGGCDIYLGSSRTEDSFPTRRRGRPFA
jgi:hypothetical protein